MSINVPSYPKSAYPPLRKSVTMVPRVFILSWDNHKLTYKRRDGDDWHEAWGTLYPSGKITLENGMFYESRSQMEAAYRQAGSYRVVFLDEPESGET